MDPNSRTLRASDYVAECAVEITGAAYRTLCRALGFDTVAVPLAPRNRAERRASKRAR